MKQMKLTKILTILVFILLFSVIAIPADELTAEQISKIPRSPYQEKCEGGFKFSYDSNAEDIVLQQVGEKVPAYTALMGGINYLKTASSVLAGPTGFFLGQMEAKAMSQAYQAMSQINPQFAQLYSQAQNIQSQIKNKQIDLGKGGSVSADCNGKAKYDNVEVPESDNTKKPLKVGSCKEGVEASNGIPNCPASYYTGGKLNTNSKTNEEEFTVTSKNNGYVEHCESSSVNRVGDCNKYLGLAEGSSVKTKEFTDADGKVKKVITEGKFIVGDPTQPIPINDKMYKFPVKGAELDYKAQYNDKGELTGSTITVKNLHILLLILERALLIQILKNHIPNSNHSL